CARSVRVSTSWDSW
nr:immunoglobulin heavy chain junction region [Macaca mulatta]